MRSERPIVERVSELARVGALLDAARAGDPAVLVLNGEAGQGKTRLARELMVAAQAVGCVTAVGLCTPMLSGQLSYGPIIDLLRDACVSRPGLSEVVSAEVWAVIQTLLSPGIDGIAVSGDLARTRLFAAVVELFGAVSAGTGAVLVIEDIHWADAASLDLLAFLARKMTNQRLVVVMTCRSGGSARSDGVRTTLSEVLRLPAATSIHLGPLSDAGIRLVIDDIVPGRPEHEMHQIIGRAAGNPFFASILAERDYAQGLPEELQDMLLRGLDDEMPLARDVLTLMHVMGGRIDEAALSQVWAASPGELVDVIRSLLDHGFLTAAGATVSFRHSLIGEAIGEQLLPGERSRAHRRAAEALTATDVTAERAGQIAVHLLGSGQHAAAMKYALMAAQRALAVWAFAEARQNYGVVLELWNSVEDPESSLGLTMVEVLCDAAEASVWTGAEDEALDFLDRALTLTSQEPERVRLLVRKGHALVAAGRVGSAVEAYELAHAAVQSIGSDAIVGAHPLAGTVLSALARAHMTRGDATRADEAATGAMVAIDAAGGTDVGTRSQAMITQAVSWAQRGDITRAIDQLSACVPAVRASDDLELVTRLYGNLTFALGIAGLPAEVVRMAEDGIAVCRRFGPVMSIASSLTSNYVGGLLAIGRWDDAWGVALRALEDSTSEAMSLYLLTGVAAIATARGDFDAAQDYLRRAQSREGDSAYTVEVAFVQADLATWRGDFAAATSAITDILTRLDEQQDDLLILDACRIGLRATADEPSVDSKRSTTAEDSLRGELLLAARSAAARTDLPLAQLVAATCQAEGARAERRDTPDMWSTIAAREAGLGRQYEQAYALYRLGACQLRGRARNVATGSLRAARELAGQLGAVPLTQSIDEVARLGRLQLAAPHDSNVHKRVSHPGNLTQREWQILQLLSGGATSRSMASTLFISERTVDVHLGHIFGKLGVSNRTQAAQMGLMLARQGP